MFDTTLLSMEFSSSDDSSVEASRTIKTWVLKPGRSSVKEVERGLVMVWYKAIESLKASGQYSDKVMRFT